MAPVYLAPDFVRWVVRETPEPVSEPYSDRRVLTLRIPLKVVLKWLSPGGTLERDIKDWFDHEGALLNNRNPSPGKRSIRTYISRVRERAPHIEVLVEAYSTLNI